MIWTEYNNSNNTTGSSSCSTDDGANLWGRIGCVLSYSGRTEDMILNYIVLGINLLTCILISLTWHRNASGARRAGDLMALFFVVSWQISLCLMVGCYGISIVWCSMVGWIISERRFLKEHHASSVTPGESLAQQADDASPTTSYHAASFMMTENQDNDNYESSHTPLRQTFWTNETVVVNRISLFVILLNIVIIAYYVEVDQFITTVAHVCAVILGAILSALIQRNCQGIEMVDDCVVTTTVEGGPGIATDPLLPDTTITTTSAPSTGVRT